MDMNVYNLLLLLFFNNILKFAAAAPIDFGLSHVTSERSIGSSTDDGHRNNDNEEAVILKRSPRKLPTWSRNYITRTSAVWCDRNSYRKRDGGLPSNCSIDLSQSGGRGDYRKRLVRRSSWNWNSPSPWNSGKIRMVGSGPGDQDSSGPLHLNPNIGTLNKRGEAKKTTGSHQA